MKIFAYSMNKCCWAGVSTGSYKKVIKKSKIIYENISFFGTKYILDHKRAKTINLDHITTSYPNPCCDESLDFIPVSQSRKYI